MIRFIKKLFRRRLRRNTGKLLTCLKLTEKLKR
jgi:hypothetical protein